MHTSTISDQTVRGTLARYDGASPGKYLSDSDSYNDNDNDSDCRSDDYNNYESNYESDNEEASCTSTSTTEAVKERKVNVTYTLRQENFNDKFSPKDLLNAIQGILSSPPRDMSNDKGSLDCLPIYSFLFLNEKGSSLYNAYDRSEMEDKLVIKIDQDGDHVPKFSVADNISEVYGLPGIHECINGQKPLRAVINIDASQKDMETTVIATSSDLSKCSYHILYAPALLIDHCELKAFTELVYTITGEKFGKYIDRILPGQNFNLRLIGSAKKGRVKRILQFSLDNGWNELDHARVQPPTSLGLEVRPRMLSTEKNNNPLRISVGLNILQKFAELVLQKHSSYLRDWIIEEKDLENFVYFNRKAPLGCPLCKRIHDKDQRDEREVVFKCDPSIAEKIQQENKKSLQPSHKVKVPGFPKAFVNFPSWAKYNESLSATETYEERYVRPLPNEGDIYVGSPWEMEKTYVLEHLTISDDVNLLVLSTRHSYSNAVTTRLNLKSYCDIDGKTFRLAPNKETVLAELWDWARQISSLPFENRKSASLICHLRKDVQGIVCTLKTDFPELRIKEYHGKSDPVEKAQDFSNVEESWIDVDLVAYTSTLKIGVSCINPKFERAFCLFNSYIETNARTNQMLFRMRCIKDYVCHIEQRSSNIPITEKGLFQWLVNAKRECLSREFQNRGIFPDIDSIIRNKDVPTIRLWVAYMLEKFRSWCLFGWRMVDFLREAGMIIFIIESDPKSNENSLSQIVKAKCSVVKTEEISDITNANILDRETAEFLENKPRKTLGEMRSLDWHHIVDCYGIPPESLTEDFISKYGNFNHMKWFRAYRQLRDAGTGNETAVEAITRKDYREDRLTTITWAEKHRICLELLKTCIPAKDIDDRSRYKADDVKTCLNSPGSVSYLQNLVPKMARVFDNSDTSRRAKKSGLKMKQAKLGLLNSALHVTYGLKFKAIDKNRRHYHLVGSFDSKDAPRFPLYQTGEEIYWENGEDTRYGYSKLPPDELIDNFTSSSKVDNAQITEDIQDLFDIC
ncbi:hypothetical protein GLOIN_2v1766623 [Rhizophagus irregularis DAOM 181602=DAOM 197198]|nr:hypothetical protein GLOIN_2v1766623 [Rhizophagus irregularis DAOM 181602=DAOM 197198]